MSYAKWQVAVAPPWLQDQWGAAWLGGHGAIKDDYLSQIIAGSKAALPELAPVDALPPLADEMGLSQGPLESNADFATRLRQAWFYWPYAGTPVGLLVALHFAGLTGAVIVQQNGLQHSLTEPYTAGADPTANLVVSNTSTLASTLTSSVNSSRTIPAGTPWWFFDSNTDFCSRFEIISPSWPFSALTTATFNNSSTATITFPFTFANNSYAVLIGPPSDAVTIVVDGTSLTTTQCTLTASAAWTGSVQVIAFASGVNPFNTFTTASVGALKDTIVKWKPAKATCMGVSTIQSGRVWGYPVTAKWGDVGATWGGSVQTILGVF